MDQAEQAKYMKALEVLFQAHGRVYEAKDSIFKEGDPGDKVYFILSGSVNVYIGSGYAKRVLWSLLPGDIFGEMALFDNLSRTASIDALERTRLVVLDREQFNHLIAKYPILAQRVIELMASRMRKMDTQFKLESGYLKGQQMGQTLDTDKESFIYGSFYARDVLTPMESPPGEFLP